jgi:hypothetical protein
VTHSIEILAEVDGFEPPHVGIKTRCLRPAWLYPHEHYIFTVQKNFGRIGRNRTLRTPSPTGAENTRGMLLRAELRFPARNTLPLSYVPMLSIYSTEKSLVGRAYLVEYAFFSRAVKWLARTPETYVTYLQYRKNFSS